jgi:hypothetical protein
VNNRYAASTGTTPLFGPTGSCYYPA